MNTLDLIEVIRTDVRNGLREEIIAELQPEIEKRLYANIFDFREAMAYLKISEPNLRRMVRDGEIPYFRQRRNIYFRQIDLDQNIAKRVVRKEVRAQ